MLSLHDVAVPPNTNVTVVSFDTEVALLKAFAAYVQHSDADVLVGYNTCGFDWKYWNCFSLGDQTRIKTKKT